MRSLTRLSPIRIVSLILLFALLSTERTSSQGVRPLIRGVEIVAGRQAAAGEVLVKFRSGLPPAIGQLLGLESTEALAAGLYRLRSRQRTVSALVASLATRSDVSYVEPNYLVRVDAVPSDPHFMAEAGLLNQERPGSDIHAEAAWDFGTGTRAGVVALLDSGIDYHHPDLVGNLWSAPTPFTVTIAGRSITCPVGTVGFDAVRLTCDPLDDHGHGTAMAGIVGAVGNNGIGIAGVNWTTSLMALKFIRSDGIGSYADAINAIEFALQVRDIFGAAGGARVRILSNSWTGNAFSQALLEALDRANGQGMLVVASAGNDGRDNDAQPMYPASFDAPNVVSVLATGVDDSREPYSNFGVTTVDVGAPGLTYTTTSGGGYASMAGTSVAAALVSGVASLVLSQCGLTPVHLRSALLQTVDLVEPLRWITVTGGRVNARRTLELCRGSNAPPAVDIVSPGHLSTFAAFAPVSIMAEAYDADGSVVGVEFFAGNRWLGRDTASPFQIQMGPVPAGSYVVTAVATDNSGATSMTRPVTVLVRSAGSLPSPWQFQDVGAVGAPGDATATGGRWTVQGSGADVWGAADGFGFLHQPLVGDGEMIVRVSSIENVDPWTKAGIMIRESLSSDAAHAFILVSAGKGIAFQRRAVTGASSTHTAGAASGAPHWIRLARAGATVIASTSQDRVTWTVVGTEVMAWPATVHIGLAVTSHATDRLALAQFDSLTFAAGPPSAPDSGTPHAALPDGWANADVGSTGLPGRATGSGGTFTLTGAGADVWGTADAFQFAYRTLHGDGQIVARVTAVDGAASWTKAGVMMRDTLDPGSAHAFMLTSVSKGAAFQRRVQGQGQTMHTAGVSEAPPLWLRLVRRGQTMTASTSPDAVVWTDVGQDVVSMGPTVVVGLAVSSHDAGQTASARFEGVSVTSAVSNQLPAGWSAMDIGPTGPAGSVSVSGSTLAVTGGGADVWGSEDAFQFVFTALAGDGSVTARVASIEPVHAWTKAGVMLRQSLDAASPHAFMLVSAGRGLAFQRRVQPGGVSTHTPGGGGAPPHWVRLMRSGSVIVASVSPDGSTWTEIGTETLSMPGAIYAGLVVSSHDASRAATVAFTDVRVGP